VITILLGLLVLFAFCIAVMLWYINENLGRIVNELSWFGKRAEEAIESGKAIDMPLSRQGAGKFSHYPSGFFPHAPVRSASNKSGCALFHLDSMSISGRFSSFSHLRPSSTTA
jgi:hypothetical protein